MQRARFIFTGTSCSLCYSKKLFHENNWQLGEHLLVICVVLLKTDKKAIYFLQKFLFVFLFILLQIIF
jgi:hypothetical protein